MAKFLAAEFVRWARTAINDDSQLVDAVHEAIERRAHANSVDIDKYLRRFGVYNVYRDAMVVGLKQIRDEEIFVELINKLGLSAELDFRCPPWVRWRAGATVAIVFGERLVQIPKVASAMNQLAVGARDAEAIATLVDALRSKLQIDCAIELHHVRSDLDTKRAEKKLDTLRSRPDVGAIVVVGSPIVNPLAEPIAKLITGNDETLMPGKFQWSFSVGPDKPLLSDPRKHPKNQEGIWNNSTDLLIPRVHDDHVLDALKDKTGQLEFADCGMLLMDTRMLPGTNNNPSPFLILCAGHGGAGTQGCVRAVVSMEQQIAARLASNEGRLLDIVEVKRKKRIYDPAEIDDLVVNEETVKFVSSTLPWPPSCRLTFA